MCVNVYVQFPLLCVGVPVGIHNANKQIDPPLLYTVGYRKGN